MIPQLLPIRYFLNPSARRNLPYPPGLRALVSLAAHQEAYREISSWEEYRPTPLLELSGLAESLGIRSLLYKDEGARLGLGSFKALGGTYGVYRVVAEALEGAGLPPASSDELRRGRHRAFTQEMTITCASVGNHGQAVTRGASMFGCRAKIFLPAGSAPGRKQAILDLGGEVVEVEGSYDDAVGVADHQAKTRGWWVVSDTAYPGYERIPLHIMQGYTVMVQEVLDQLPPKYSPTHVFLQGGVGGLAAAVTAHLWESLEDRRPLVTVVEPAEADCLLESALAGTARASRGTLDTSMAPLACREPSLVAWRILEGGADAFLSIPDYAAEETVSLLETGVRGDPGVRSQPAGVAGLTGLIGATFEPTLSGPLGLGRESRVLVFGSEGPPHGE